MNRDITETIEHVSFEGNEKVIYEIEINYTEDDILGLDILSVNGLNDAFITDWFIQTMKDEIIEDMVAERRECCRSTGGLLCPEYAD